MARLTSLSVTAVATVLLLTSCTQQQPGDASPTVQGIPVPSHTTTSDPADKSSLPAYGAPKVRNPLDIASFKANPCQALTDQQVTKVVGQKNEVVPRPEDAEGPACSYRREVLHGGQVKVSFLTVYQRGLSGIYQQKGDKYQFFKELPLVHDYPAAAVGIRDQRYEGTCLVAVGVSDRDAFGVAMHLSERNVGKKDPCEVGHTVAGMVLENIKGAQ